MFAVSLIFIASLSGEPPNIRMSPSRCSRRGTGRCELGVDGSAGGRAAGPLEIVWEQIMEFAKNELESGHRAASVAIGDRKPLRRARFLVLR